MSLLAKYGSTLDLKVLYREFLLTIMGQFLSGDSCYYAKDENRGAFVPSLIYGGIEEATLPSFDLDSDFVDYLEQNPYPSLISKLPTELLSGDEIEVLKNNYEVISPHCLKNKLLGIALLGKKISSQPYSDAEITLMQSFGVVSAMTFNHASLFENAKLSIAELNKLNNIRTEIFSRVTHEFRTPLTVIKGGLAALKLEDEQLEVVKWIEDSVNRLEDLISSLLDLNKSCFEDTIISLNDWDPAAIIHEAVLIHTEAADSRDISIQITEITPGSIPQLKITDERFRHMLNNLIDNAIKFSENSSTIRLGFEQELRGPSAETDGIRLPDWKEQFQNRIGEYSALSGIEFAEPLISPPVDPGGGPAEETADGRRFVVFKITDGGIGIPDEEISSLAEPFHQASNSPTRNIRGTGLGLSVSQRIISRRGGHIYCKSEEGLGTTFTVFLPLK
jgi:signal transduction histidine kinase